MKRALKSLFLLVSVLALFGCGNKEPQSANEIVQWSEFLSPTTPIYSQRKVVLDKFLKDNPLPMPFAQDMGPALYRERAQRYLLQGKSGYPDIIEGTLEQVYSYVSAGMAYPLNDLFNNDAEKDVFEPALIEAFTMNGNLYAFPNVANVRLLIYRKDLFEKNNLSVPETWDELVNAAKTIKEKEGINGFMFTTQTKEIRAFQEFMSFYYTLADKIYEVNGDKAVYVADKNNFAKVLKLYKDIFAAAIDPNAKGQDWKSVDYGITGGQTAMVVDGPWIWEHITEDPNREAVMTNLAVAPIPVPTAGQPSATYMEVKGYVINPNSPDEKKENIYKAMKSLVAKPIIEVEVEYSSATPIRKDVESKNSFGQSFSEYLHLGKVLEFINWDVPQNYIIDAIQTVIYDRATPEEAADTLDKQLKEYESQATVRQDN